jgi:phenylpyruvate tautomerase PptA (4-oxalocrotonate tautomerase family)
MPWVEVTLLESHLTEGTSQKLSAAVFEAVVSVLGESVSPITYVVVNGVDSERFGSARTIRGTAK